MLLIAIASGASIARGETSLEDVFIKFMARGEETGGNGKGGEDGR